MILKYKVIIISIIAIIIIFIVITAILFTKLYNTPEQVFKRKFYFALPKSAEIINYRIGDDDNFYMMAMFEINDYEIMEEKLENYFKGLVKNDFMFTAERAFNAIKVTCPWWELNDNEIITSYYSSASGRKYKTRDILAFIVKSKDNQYYLYVMN